MITPTQAAFKAAEKRAPIVQKMLESAYETIEYAAEKGRNKTEANLKIGLVEHVIHIEHYEDVRTILVNKGFNASIVETPGQSPMIVISW